MPPLPISGTKLLVQYEWDNGKAAENLRKHGVDFADAVAALEDLNRLEEIDAQFVYGEERMQVGVMAPQGWKREYDGWDPAAAWARPLATLPSK